MVRIGIKPHQLGATLSQLRLAWREAEEAGFESVWVFDHVNRVNEQPCLEALGLLSALACQISRMRLGVLVINPGLRHPAYVAGVAATVDQLSNGRMELGVGAGSPFGMLDLAACGLPTPSLRERVALLDEYCQVLRRLWTGEKVDFAGRYFQLRGAHMGAQPVQRELPLIVGGGSRRAMEVAARHATEWNLSTADPDEFRRRSGEFDELTQETGRPVAKSVQLNLRGVPDRDLEIAVQRCVDAGAERVILVLEPPYYEGSITTLGRRVLGSPIG